MRRIFTLRIFCFNLHIMNFYKKAAILSTIVLSTGAAAQNKAEVITENLRRERNIFLGLTTPTREQAKSRPLLTSIFSVG